MSYSPSLQYLFDEPHTIVLLQIHHRLQIPTSIWPFQSVKEKTADAFNHNYCCIMGDLGLRRGDKLFKIDAKPDWILRQM